MIQDDDLRSLSREEIQETIVKPKLSQQLRLAADRSPFWARRFAESGIDPRAVRGIDDLCDLPLLDKPELLADQHGQAPGGSLLAVPMSDIRRIHRTSGSTSSPFIVMLSGGDVETAQAVGARALRCAGVRADDLVVHCLNYAMWSGGVTDHMCFETAGAAVIPYGVGNSRYLVETVQRLRPTAISCTPSYLFKLQELCLNELGIPPKSLGLAKAFLGGEGGLQEAAYRSQIEEAWGMPVVDANYGMSEVMSIFASECAYRCGLHFHAEDVLLPELIDPQGQAIAIVPGAKGELVLSTLTPKAQPLFRYRTHDQIEICGTGCACGRSGFLFKVLGRTDDMCIIKGINFFPSSIRGLLAEFGRDVVGEYRVHRPDSTRDTVRVEVEVAAEPQRASELAQTIASLVSERLSVSVMVTPVDFGTFPRSDDKTRVVV